ncbi:6-phosphofructokinase [Enterococcus faecalis]|nr:6-phosphofructokinase [Enterococcus faecalis]
MLDNQVVAADIIDTLENNKHKPDLSLYEFNHCLLYTSRCV